MALQTLQHSTLVSPINIGRVQRKRRNFLKCGNMVTSQHGVVSYNPLFSMTYCKWVGLARGEISPRKISGVIISPYLTLVLAHLVLGFYKLLLDVFSLGCERNLLDSNVLNRGKEDILALRVLGCLWKLVTSL